MSYCQEELGGCRSKAAPDTTEAVRNTHWAYSGSSGCLQLKQQLSICCSSGRLNLLRSIPTAGILRRCRPSRPALGGLGKQDVQWTKIAGGLPVPGVLLRFPHILRSALGCQSP